MLTVAQHAKKSLVWHAVLLCVLLAVLHFYCHEFLLLERSAILQGEYWRVITGNFVHTNLNHLLMNLSGLIVLVFLFKETINISLFYITLVFLSVVVGLSVFIFSNLSWYAGLSAVLYGLFIVSAVVALIKKDWLLSLPVLLVIPIKLIFDSYDPGLTASSAELIGAPVATGAHGYGVLAGFFVGGILLLFKPKRLIE